MQQKKMFVMEGLPGDGKTQKALAAIFPVVQLRAWTVLCASLFLLPVFWLLKALGRAKEREMIQQLDGSRRGWPSQLCLRLLGQINSVNGKCSSWMRDRALARSLSIWDCQSWCHWELAFDFSLSFCIFLKGAGQGNDLLSSFAKAHHSFKRKLIFRQVYCITQFSF